MLQGEIKRLREARGMKQEELAVLIPMTQHALSQIENGKRKVSTELFEDIMKILDAIPTLQVQDETTNRTVNVNEYFHGEAGLKRQFPTWDIMHTGGSNNYLLTKNFKSLAKKSIAVSVSTDAVWIHKKLIPNEAFEDGIQVVEEYVDFKEWDTNREMYQEFLESNMIMLLDIHKEEEEFEPLARELFSEKNLEEMLKVIHVL